MYLYKEKFLFYGPSYIAIVIHYYLCVKSIQEKHPSTLFLQKTTKST